MLTEDGWFLTVFRVIGRNGKRPSLREENIKKPPVLAQHGAFDSASEWAGSGVGGPTLPLQLVDQGYDVWMGVNRGNWFSNSHQRDGEWSLEEKWDFNWADMGLYDVPAFVEKMLEVTGKPKVTLLGYSQGSA